MLEISHVTKIYRTKGGVETKALDDVSITFGETGLVFLLGKSGSGKSTLLNVSGGLDEPTEGEVIVKGKSSEDFTSSDFDSYRNTFVGFIFQEYNILDEFNVEDNIALALELQGKPKDKEKINKLLEDVDLAQYAKRRPNTLSGGQKQRIAIARALIKDPQIIMADEPTGALDSATGKQVFDTLKKLSETRLVIVVSHDREFAEIYGDRIVELKDGKIISDVSKSYVPPRELDENVTVIGGNTLSIKSGASLTQNNFLTIQNFIKSAGSDVIVTTGATEISNFKKANRMSEDGATETFTDTRTDKLKVKEYSEEDSEFIRSRLPAGKAIKIGASGLKLKPIRLVFTILLSFIAFTMFGLLSTLMVYDGDAVAVNSFVQSKNYEFLNLTKGYLVHYKSSYSGGGGYEYTQTNNLRFTDAELNEFTEKFGESTFGYYSLNGAKIINALVDTDKNSDYYRTDIVSVANVPAWHSVVKKLAAGRYPVAVDEICISSYTVEVLKNATVYGVVKNGNDFKVDNLNTIKINSANDLLDKYIVVSVGATNLFMKVSGVFECENVPEKFDGLKTPGNNDYMLMNTYESYLKENTHVMAFVSDGFYDKYENLLSSNTSGSGEYKQYFKHFDNEMELDYSRYDYDFDTGNWNVNNDYSQKSTVNRAAAYNHGAKNQLKVHFLGTENAGKTSLADNEIVVGFNLLNDILDRNIMNYYIGKVKEGVYNGFGGGSFDNNKQSGESDLGYNNRVYYHSVSVKSEEFDKPLQIYTQGNKYDEASGSPVNCTVKERKEALNKIAEVLKEIGSEKITFKIDDLREFEFKVVGVYESDIEHNSDADRWAVYLSQSFISSNLTENKYSSTTESTTKYEFEEGQKYGGIYVAFNHTESAIRDIFSMIGEENAKANDVVYELQASLYTSIMMANSYAELLSTIFLWVGVVFAVFSALLLFNFISMSISSKRKEIGILRAVGARGIDVFKIFFSESGIIVGICTILAIIGAAVGCGIINGILNSSVGLEVTLFVFAGASVGMMIGIALLVAVVSTFLPVFFAARRKPVDSIRAV